MKDVYAYIEDYISGQLTGEELAAFEKAMKEDDELRSLVENYSGLEKIAEGMLERDIELNIADVHQEHAGQPFLGEKEAGEADHSSPSENEAQTQTGQEKTASIITQRRRWWIVAAAVGVFIVGATFLWSQLKPTVELSSSEILAGLSRSPQWPASRSGTNQELTYEEKAYREYQKGNFSGAKTILLDSIDDKNLGRYWLAEMYLANEEVDSTLKYAPILSSDHIYYENNNRMRAVALLVKGEKEKAFKVYPEIKKEYKSLLK